MTLLYITNQICGAAGLERVLSIKASYLADKLNYKVHIITLNQNDTPLFYKFSNKLVYHDIEVKGNPITYIYSYISKIKRKVKEINPDVISVCDDGLKAFFLPYLIGKNQPIIYERHVSKNIQSQVENASFSHRIKTNIIYAIMGVLARRYDKFVVLTRDNIREWNLKNIQVISNPLPFYPKEQSKLTNKKVLVVGRQCFQKGYDRLLKSWEIIAKKYPEWTLDIYGKYQDGEPYKKMAIELGISDSVEFYQPVKNIEEVYREASIYVMSSRFEGFGMVLIEAMSYGVPCVSFDCPCGPQEIISNEKDGFLVKNGNIEDLARQIEKLIEDQNLRIDMGKNAREKASKYFPDAIIPKWDALFNSLIEK